METKSKLIGRLDLLLDQERDALMASDLQALSLIVEEKELLIEQLSVETGVINEEISPVGDKVRRNHILLEQALNGIRSVSSKLAELRQARKAFDTYDRLGHRNSIKAGSEATVEKRA